MAYAVCGELNVPARFEKFAAADPHSAAAQTSSVVTALASTAPVFAADAGTEELLSASRSSVVLFGFLPRASERTLGVDATGGTA